MNISILINLRIPNNTDKKELDLISSKIFNPFIKLLKHNKTFRCTINLPFSSSCILDPLIIKDIKDLYELGQLEFIGSYGLDPKVGYLSVNTLEQQLLLNEVSLGYYFGKHQDLEGSDSFLIKNLNGFFFEDSYINPQLLSNIKEYNYKWIALDPSLIAPTEGQNPLKGYYKVKELDVELIVFNKITLEFMSGDFAPNSFNYLNAFDFKDSSVDSFSALETYIHNNQEKGNSFCALNDNVNRLDFYKIDNVEFLQTSLNSQIKDVFRDIETHYIDNLDTLIKPHPEKHKLEVAPFWKNEVLSTISDDNLKNAIFKNLLAHKAFSFDSLEELELYKQKYSL